MNVCMYVCMYVLMYACLYVRMYVVCMYVCMYKHSHNECADYSVSCTHQRLEKRHFNPRNSEKSSLLNDSDKLYLCYSLQFIITMSYLTY